MHRWILAVVALVIPVAAAAQQFATVSGSAGLTVNGVSVPTAGIPRWPVSAGDEIATGTDSASILFQDGSRITLGRNTRARLSTHSPVGIDLLAGTANYKFVSPANSEVNAFGRPVDLHSLSEGVVAIEGADQVTVRPRGRGENADNASALKNKKPKPRSGHDKDDDRLEH